MYKIIGADGKEYGPVPADQMRQWIAEGRADGQTQVLAEGATDWKPLSQFPEFAASLPPARARTAPPIQMAARAPMAAAPASATPKTNALAVTSLVLGILAVTFALCCCYGLPFSIPALLFAWGALSQIRADPLTQQGRGLAFAGLALSLFSLLLGALGFFLRLALSKSDLFRRLENL